VKSDRTSETGSSGSDASAQKDGSVKTDHPPLENIAEPSGGSEQLDRGTSLPERSTPLDMGGGSNSGNMGGGASGKDWFGLSFQYSQEKLAEVQRRTDEVKARNEAAEAAKTKVRTV
jgi:hypothetical protein